VQRPPAQRDWGFDGVSILPILRGETPEERGIGWMYNVPVAGENGYAYRYGKWKYVAGGASCVAAQATFNCSRPQLYDMSVDYVEDHDLREAEPEVFAAIAANFSAWFASVHNSMDNESMCSGTPPPSPPPFPPNPAPSTNCTCQSGAALNGKDTATGHVESLDLCCGACLITPGCTGMDYAAASPMKPGVQGQVTGGTCHLKSIPFSPKPGAATQTACKAPV